MNIEILSAAQDGYTMLHDSELHLVCYIKDLPHVYRHNWKCI